MAEEIKKVITIEVGKSITSIRDFRKHIEDLRGSLLVLNQDSEEYKTIAAEIAQNQEKLNEVMKVGKSDTDAAAGSYVELNNQLKALRNQYKALSESDREGAVGKNMLVNIQQLDEKLKDLDEGMGVYNRNVGNYKQAFEEAFKAVAQNIGNVNPQLGKLMQTASSLIPLIKAASNAATTGLKGIKAGLVSTGIGALVVVLGEILANWDKIATAVSKAIGLQNRYTQEVDKSNTAVGRLVINVQSMLSNLQAIASAQGKTAREQAELSLDFLDKQRHFLNNFINIRNVINDTLSSRASVSEGAYISKYADYIGDLSLAIQGLIFQLTLLGKTEEAEPFKELLSKLGAANSALEVDRQTKALKDFLRDNKEAFDDVEKQLNSIPNLITQAENNLQVAKEAEKKAAKDAKEEADKAFLSTEEKLRAEAQKQIDQINKLKEERTLTEKEAAGIILSINKKLDKDIADAREQAWKSSSGYAKLQEDLNNIKAIQERLKNQGKDEMEILQETYEAEKALLIKYNQDTTKLDEEYWLNKLNIIHENARDVEEAINGIVEEIKNSWREAYQEELNTQSLFESQAISAVSTKMVNGRTTTGDSSSDIAAERQKEDEIFMIQKAGYEARIQSHQDYLMLLDEGDQEYLDVQRQIAEEEMGLAELVYNHTAEIEERKREDLQETLRIAQGMIQAYGNLGSTIAGIIADASEEGTSRWKAARITETVISTIAGAAGAFMQGMSSYPQPWGAIIGAAGAAAATATGAAEIAKIKKTQIGGSSSVSGISVSSSQGASVSPLLNPDYDLQRITNLSLQSDDYLPGKTQVYVLESDIQEVGNRVQVRENNATF